MYLIREIVDHNESESIELCTVESEGIAKELVNSLKGYSYDLEYLKVDKVESIEQFEEKFTVNQYFYEIEVRRMNDNTYIVNHREQKYLDLDNCDGVPLLRTDISERNVTRVSLYAYSYDDISTNLKQQVRFLINNLVSAGETNKKNHAEKIEELFRITFKNKIKHSDKL